MARIDGGPEALLRIDERRRLLARAPLGLVLLTGDAAAGLPTPLVTVTDTPVRRETDYGRQGEFKEYALAGESYAISLIEKDSKLNQVDSLKDSWAKPLKPLTINQAKVNVTLEDDAARFNINNLYHDGKVDEAGGVF